MNLTTRQEQIIRLISLGDSTKQMAHRLSVCEGVIEYHRNKIVKRLGCKNMYEAVAKYWQLNCKR